MESAKKGCIIHPFVPLTIHPSIHESFDCIFWSYSEPSSLLIKKSPDSFKDIIMQNFLKKGKETVVCFLEKSPS